MCVQGKGENVGDRSPVGHFGGQPSTPLVCVWGGGWWVLRIVFLLVFSCLYIAPSFLTYVQMNRSVWVGQVRPQGSVVKSERLKLMAVDGGMGSGFRG